MLKLAVALAVAVMLIATALGDQFTFRDSSLAGYTYETEAGATWLDCLGKCIADVRCLSYKNFFKAPDDEGNICELNKDNYSNACNTNRHLISRPGWIYSERPKKDDGVAALNLTANISCDNWCKVYADGELIATDNRNWITPETFALPRGTKVLGIHAFDNAGKNGKGGLIGSLSTGKSTDSSWKCSNTNLSGWNTARFDASAWPAAHEHGGNGHDPWNTKLTGLASGAKWIWTKDNVNDNEVYCRIEI